MNEGRWEGRKMGGMKEKGEGRKGKVGMKKKGERRKEGKGGDEGKGGNEEGRK